VAVNPDSGGDCSLGLARLLDISLQRLHQLIWARWISVWQSIPPLPASIKEYTSLMAVRHHLIRQEQSWLHPVIRRLPRDHHVTVEKDLLGTFGRVMPVLMTLCVVLSIVHAARAVHVNALHWLSAVTFTPALVSTLIFNVLTRHRIQRCLA
jgi:hypothetical protein